MTVRTIKGFQKAGLMSAVLLIACVLMGAGIAALPGHAYAYAATATLPTHQTFASDTPGVDDTFSYCLKATSSDAPLPDGAEAGTYRWTLSGNNEYRISFDVDTVGIYEYTMYQDVPTAVEGYAYDSTVYTVRLYASNAPGGGIDVRFIVTDEAGEKAIDPGWTVAYAGASSDGGDEAAGATTGGWIPVTGDTLWTIGFALVALIAGGLALIVSARRRQSREEKNAVGPRAHVAPSGEGADAKPDSDERG